MSFIAVNSVIFAKSCHSFSISVGYCMEIGGMELRQIMESLHDNYNRYRSFVTNARA